MDKENKRILAYALSISFLFSSCIMVNQKKDAVIAPEKINLELHLESDLNKKLNKKHH